MLKQSLNCTVAPSDLTVRSRRELQSRSQYHMSGNNLKILLAEDDPNLGTLLVDYLRAEGFEIKLCKDGEQALTEIRKNRFNLCLLDVMMPKMDGFSLAKEIREVDKNMPIIFI